MLELWGCRQGTLPDVDLGLPLRAKYRCISIWDPILGRIKKRLALWKRGYLSQGGRLVLIKSMLQNLPVYALSCCLIPVLVLEEIEKTIRRFLWGKTDGKMKPHLVSF